MAKKKRKYKSVKIKKGFSIGWNPNEVEITNCANGYFSLKKWQGEAVHDIGDEKLFLINAPMGSGKTFVSGCIAIDRLMKNKKMLVIFSVPQTIISYGFKEMRIKLPNGEDFYLVPRHDLCNDTIKDNIKNLIDFLKNPHSEHDILDRIIVCSHAALVRVFKQRPDLFRNVLAFLDEAHHIWYTQNTEIEDIEMSNGIGNILKEAIKNGNKKNLQVGLTTATLFRGDMGEIIPKKYLTKFKRFDLPYDEFFKTLRYLHSFSYDFALCINFKEALMELLKDNFGKPIFYIPPVRNHFSTGCKHNDVSEIYKAIALNDNPEIIEENGLVKIKRKDKWLKGVNLVEEKDRELRKDIINKAHESNDSSDLDFIIALGVFKEGGNWKWADREFIMGNRNSFNEVVQIVGRLFRDVEGKKHVSVYHLLSVAFDQTDKEKTKCDLNDYIKMIFALMMMEEMFYPVNLHFPKTKGEKIGENRKNNIKINYLQEAGISITEEFSIKTEIMKNIFKNNSIEELNNYGNMSKNFNEIASKILSEHGVKKHHEEIADKFWKEMQRSGLQMEGYDIHNVDIEIIKSFNPFKCMLHFMSGICGINTFEDLKKAIKKYCFMAYEDLKKEIAKMRKNGQPLCSIEEYQVWVRNRCNYDVVIKYRENKKNKKKGNKQ